MASIVSIPSCGYRSGELCTKEGFVTSNRRNRGSGVVRTLNDPGPREEFYKEYKIMSSSALLPPQNFEVFERHYLLEYYT